MFDAYTVKKVLPRLVIAAILIQLSWEIFTLMIELVGQIAWGIEGLLYAPFGGRGALSLDNAINVTGGGALFNAAAIAAAAGAGISLGLVGVLSLALSALIALVIGFFVLAVRQIVVIILLVIAPLALVAWILPNTEKFWKIWWESFSKLLLMYPLILLLIAGGRVAARVVAEIDLSGGWTEDQLEGGFVLLIVVIGYFGPFFLIPKTFQVAGSAFANITGMVNNRSKGVFDRLAKGRAEKRKDRISRAGANSLWNQKQPGWKGGIAKRANTLAGWGVAPVSNYQYAARNTRLPGSRQGRLLESHIGHQRIEQSEKLFKELNSMFGSNDKAYRAMTGAWGGLSQETQDRLIAEGYHDSSGNLQASALNSEESIKRFAGILGKSSESTERTAATALLDAAPRIGTLFGDEEMTKADTQIAGLFGLASHGFMSPDDLNQVGNDIAGPDGHEFGLAQAVVTQAEVMASGSRPDNKAGYGHVVEEDANGHKRFVSGMGSKDDAKNGILGSRTLAWASTLDPGAIARSKGGFLKDRGKQLQTIITTGKTEEAKSKLTEVRRRQAAGQSTDSIRQELGHAYVDEAEMARLSPIMEQQLQQAVSPYSQASADIAAEAAYLLTEMNIEPRTAATMSPEEIEAMRRGAEDGGAAGATPAPE